MEVYLNYYDCDSLMDWQQQSDGLTQLSVLIRYESLNYNF
jgi:hypothetical protein